MAKGQEELVTRLLEAAGDHDKAELGMVHNARIAAMRAYRERPGKETKSDWDAARQAHQEPVERLAAIYFPAEEKAPEGERFKNRKQALNWLQAQGYKVSQGKFYQDCEAGFPGIHKDGSVSRYQVMQYGQQLDVERRSGERVDYDREQDEARKIKADADRAEMQAETMRRQMDRDWLHSDQAWAAVAEIIGAIDDSLRFEFYGAQNEMVLLVGGHQDRAPQLYSLCEEVVGRALDQVASRAEINVDFAGIQEG